MGGTAVYLTGPCFEKADIVKCTFDDQKDINGFVVNNLTAVCVSPRFDEIGWKTLTLTIVRNNVDAYSGQSRFYAGIVQK